MWNGFWVALATMTLSLALPPDGRLELGARSVLVYKNEVRDESSRFVVRLARFKPDIVLEWENLNDQGTVHLYRKAVSQGQQLTFSALFEVGVEMRSEDVMTLWMAEEAFNQMVDKGSVKMKRSNLPFKIERKGRATVTLTLNGEQVELPVWKVKDSRGGEWTVLDDASNPLILSYKTPYFSQRLEIINTEDQRPLRWIKRPPPIK